MTTFSVNQPPRAGHRIRAMALAATAIVVTATASGEAKAQISLPEITVTAPPQPPKSVGQPDQKGNGDGKTGSDAKSGDGHALDRLNQQLKRKVDETNPIGNAPPLDARSPDTKTGVVNIPGVQQQYGKNFGNSVIPYRPAAPVYTSPFGHR